MSNVSVKGPTDPLPIWSFDNYIRHGTLDIPTVDIEYPLLPLVSCFRFRMRFVVLGPQVLETDMGVFLCGGQACVAEELLNCAKIGAPL